MGDARDLRAQLFDSLEFGRCQEPHDLEFDFSHRLHEAIVSAQCALISADPRTHRGRSGRCSVLSSHPDNRLPGEPEA